MSLFDRVMSIIAQTAMFVAAALALAVVLSVVFTN